MSQQNDTKPVKTFRVGSISAAIFRNETEKQGEIRVRYCANIQKQFRKEDGSWHQTQTFFAEDLPKLQLVTAKSFEYISLKESQAFLMGAGTLSPGNTPPLMLRDDGYGQVVCF